MRPATMLGLTVLIGMAAGCGSGTHPDVPLGIGDEAQTALRRGNGTEPRVLDPAHVDESAGSQIVQELYEGLLRFDAEARLIPGVAESWTVSDDGLRYTFNLRGDARWSNGDPVTAEDFVASFRRAVTPSTASPNAQFYLSLQNAEAVLAGELPPDRLGVTAVDSHTLEVTLATPTPWLLDMFSTRLGFPVHRPSLETHGERFARPGRLVGNGAYVLSEWVVQGHILLERNPHYWNADAVDIDRVYYYPTEDSTAEFMRYRAAEIDITQNIPVAQYAWITENMPSELRSGPYMGTYFFVFDTTEPPFDDVRVRQALSMTIDRETITERVTGAGELPAYNFVPSYVTDYPAAEYEWRSWPTERRLAEARRLYREAGYGPDNPLSFTIHYNTSENHRRIVVAMASMWREALGADVGLLNREWKVLLEERRDPSNWEMLRMGWIGGWNDAYVFLEILLSGSAFNDAGYDDPAFDRALMESNVVRDRTERAELLASAERRMLADYPIIPLYFYVTNRLVAPRVEGYEANIMDYTPSRLYGFGRAP